MAQQAYQVHKIYPETLTDEDDSGLSALLQKEATCDEDVIINLWNHSTDSSANKPTSHIAQEPFKHLLMLAKALGTRSKPLQILVVCNHLFSIDGEIIKNPEHALLTGPLLVIPQEMPHIQTSLLDVAELDARVVLVYPGPVEQLTELAQQFLRGNQLPQNFTIVTDPGYEMTGEYHLRWDAERETAYPSTFIVDPKLQVTFAKVSKSHGGRTKPSDIIAALKD